MSNHPLRFAKSLSHHKVPRNFGDLLRLVRQKEALTSAEFAERLGVSRTNLWYIERRRKLITPSHAARWAAALGYNIDEFVQLALQSLVDHAGLRLQVSVTRP